MLCTKWGTEKCFKLKIKLSRTPRGRCFTLQDKHTVDFLSNTMAGTKIHFMTQKINSKLRSNKKADTIVELFSCWYCRFFPLRMFSKSKSWTAKIKRWFLQYRSSKIPTEMIINWFLSLGCLINRKCTIIVQSFSELLSFQRTFP